MARTLPPSKRDPSTKDKATYRRRQINIYEDEKSINSRILANKTASATSLTPTLTHCSPLSELSSDALLLSSSVPSDEDSTKRYLSFSNTICSRISEWSPEAQLLPPVPSDECQLCQVIGLHVPVKNSKYFEVVVCWWASPWSMMIKCHTKWFGVMMVHHYTEPITRRISAQSHGVSIDCLQTGGCPNRTQAATSTSERGHP